MSFFQDSSVVLHLVIFSEVREGTEANISINMSVITTPQSICDAAQKLLDQYTATKRRSSIGFFHHVSIISYTTCK